MSKRQNEESINKINIYAEKIKKYQKLIDEAKVLSSEKVSDDESTFEKDSEYDDLVTEISDGDNNSHSTSKESQVMKGDTDQPMKLSEKASQLLGASKRQLKDQSFNFHPELVASWKEILESGLDSKVKKTFEENYRNKGNCPLKAPELNPELIPLLHKTARSKDKHLSSNQDLCGRGLVALGKSLCAIFNDDDEPIEKDVLPEWLCGSSQMFCELMFQLSKTRKYQVYSYVDEKRKSVLVDSKTDDFLFRKDLDKRIKAATVLSFSPTTPGWSHARLLGLLAAILSLSLFMLLISTAAAFFFVSFNTYAFMAAECILLAVRTIHVMLRYAIHLYDTRSSPRSSSSDKRGPLAYYTELICELTVLAVDFLHHVHMLLWSNILLSMASLVICMQLRYLFHEIQRRITKHRNYLAVLNHMEQNYPMAVPEELAENSDNCAICWEKMDSARKLPCSHLFHNSCLQSWLEQDTSCPTCRLVLSMQANRRDNTTELRTESPESQTSVGRNDNHFFHFDGSRYVSWLPSFSVEVTHNRLRGDILTLAHSNSQLDAMARQVMHLFPHYPRNVVLEDLRITRSVELTVENILDGRVTLPHHVIGEIEAETSTQTQSSNNHTLPSVVTSKTWDPKFDIPVVDSQIEEQSTVGGRFSKCSNERERILQRRKEHMLLTARRKYLEKHRKSEIESTSSGSCTENIIECAS